MQALISRFGGTPALILKLLFLGLVNGLAIWALPQLITSSAWVMLVVLVGATLALDFVLLTKRFIPAKYVIIGAILLLVFQLIPIAYTVSIAFTNYSTGHIGTKQDAITQIEANSLSETDGAVSYTMLPLYSEGQEVVLALTEVPTEDTTATDGTATDGSTDGSTDTASPEPSVQTEFGGSDGTASPEPSVQTEFGAGDRKSVV